MFYERYLSLCEKFGVSPSSAAIKAGFNKATVSFWKKKYTAGIDVRPDKDVVDKICALFRCSEAWLLGFEEDQKTPTPEDGSERDELDGLFEEIRRADPQTIELIRRVVGYK